MSGAEHIPPSKKRSVFDRCFTAATRWMGSRFHRYGDNLSDERHISYRMGWYAGYRAAQKDQKR